LCAAALPILFVVAATAGCSVPGKVTDNDMALARLGVETAVQSVSQSAQTMSQREDRPLTVVLALFPDLVNHKFGAFNDIMQDKRIDVHLHIDTEETAAQ